MKVECKFMSVSHRPARDEWPERWSVRVLPIGETEFLDADCESAALAEGLAKLKWDAPLQITVDRRLAKGWQSYRFVLTDVHAG